MRGLPLHAVGRADAALGELDKAREVDPTNVSAHVVRARVRVAARCTTMRVLSSDRASIQSKSKLLQMPRAS